MSFFAKIRIFFYLYRIKYPLPKNGKPCNDRNLQDTQKRAYKPAYKKYQETAPNQPQDIPIELAEIVAVWAELPAHIKAAIKALVQTNIQGD